MIACEGVVINDINFKISHGLVKTSFFIS